MFVWWIATGLDGWVPNGGGAGDKASPPWAAADGTAGIGAGGGLLSTPWPWVWFSVFVTLVCGVILGILSAKITAAVTPKPKTVRGLSLSLSHLQHCGTPGGLRAPRSRFRGRSAP